MAGPYYVRSTDGNNADSGLTWALAKQTVAGALAVAAAGETIYVSQAHNWSQGSAITYTSAGTLGSPVYIVCVDDSAEPPTALATTAVETTTGNFGVTSTGSLYVYGVANDAGTGSSGSSASIMQNNSNSHLQVWEDCKFRLNTTSSLQRVYPTGTGTVAAMQTIWKNCSVKFGASAQAVEFQRGRFEFRGGSVESGGTSPTSLFKQPTASFMSIAEVTDFDMSNCSAGVDIAAAGAGPTDFLITCSKLPTSWSGALVSGTLVAGSRYRLHVCDSADTNYRLIETLPMGTMVQETTIVKTGGSSDGTTPYSIKMVSNASASYPSGFLVSPLNARRNTTVGSAITVTVDIIRDSVTNLTDAEVWLEVQYFSTSGFPLGSVVADAKAGFLASAADQTTSAATWTTTGLTNPNTQKLSVTFTAQEVGYIQARVVLAKASTTLYYDNVLQVS